MKSYSLFRAVESVRTVLHVSYLEVPLLVGDHLPLPVQPLPFPCQQHVSAIPAAETLSLPSMLTVMTLITSMLYIFVRYSLTSNFVILGETCSFAVGGVIVVFKFNSFMYILGKKTLTMAANWPIKEQTTTTVAITICAGHRSGNLGFWDQRR